MPVLVKIVVEPVEPPEEFDFSAFSTSRGLGLGIAIGRDESHSYSLGCRDLFIGQLALAIFLAKAGYP